MQHCCADKTFSPYLVDSTDTNQLSILFTPAYRSDTDVIMHTIHIHISTTYARLETSKDSA